MGRAKQGTYKWDLCEQTACLSEIMVRGVVYWGWNVLHFVS